MLTALLVVTTLGAAVGEAAQRIEDADAQRDVAYRATGVIRSFGEDRRTVVIAHDEIPGYMRAMTMSFAAGAVGQLERFSVGDRVVFSFRDDEGARVIETIAARR